MTYGAQALSILVNCLQNLFGKILFKHLKSVFKTALNMNESFEKLLKREPNLKEEIIDY